MKLAAGEENTRVILAKLEEPASNANPISTPAVEKAIDALKTSCADLHNVVEDPLPAVKAVADEVLAARMDKGVSFNAEGEIGQPTTCDAAGPSKPHLPSPRRMPPSPLPPQENISKHRRARKCWSLLEEETLRNGVQQYVILS
jgi:telomeric repeat-binding factor 2